MTLFRSVCKPCLHGSDAHNHASTGRPDGDRFSWVKGALTFDALRQVCIDPEGRAFVGVEPPRSAMPSQVISQVDRSEEHTSELQSLMRISYAVFCLKKKKDNHVIKSTHRPHQLHSEELPR